MSTASASVVAWMLSCNSGVIDPFMVFLTTELSKPTTWEGDQAVLCRHLDAVSRLRPPTLLPLLASHIEHHDRRYLYNNYLVPPKTAYPVIRVLHAYGLDAIPHLLTLIKSIDTSAPLSPKYNAPSLAVYSLVTLLGNVDIGKQYARHLINAGMQTADPIQKERLRAALQQSVLRE